MGLKVLEDQGNLSGIGIFADLPRDDLDRVGRRCRWRRYRTDQQILGHLDRTADVYFIVDGKVRAIAFALNGKEVQFRDIGAGEIFGEFAAIDNQPRAADVVALEDSIVASLPAKTFQDVLHDYPAVSLAVLKLLVKQVRVLTERVFEYATLGAKNRLHAELLRLAREHMTDENAAAISPIPTHAEIGQRITSHREAVTRELSALSRMGLVTRQGSALIVPDVARLERLVKEVLGEQLDQL